MRVTKSEPHVLLAKTFAKSLRSFRLMLTGYANDMYLNRPQDNILGDSEVQSCAWYLQHAKFTRSQKELALEEVDKVLAQEVPRIQRLKEELKGKGISVHFHSHQLNRMRNDVARD